MKELNKLSEIENQSFPVISNKVLNKIVNYYGFGFFFILILVGLLAFFTSNFEVVLNTTFLSLLLISLTFLTKFENALLNSMLSLSFCWFISMCTFLIPIIDDLMSFFRDFLLHFIIALFQLFLIVSLKIKFSKQGLYWSSIFWMCWAFLYDDLYRMFLMLNIDAPIIAVQIFLFYSLFLSVFIFVFIKKKFNLLLP